MILDKLFLDIDSYLLCNRKLFICNIISKTTPTKINKEVPPQNLLKELLTPANLAKRGKIDIKAKNNAPGTVSLF